MLCLHATPNLQLANAIAGTMFGLFNLMCGFLRPQPVSREVKKPATLGQQGGLCLPPRLHQLSSLRLHAGRSSGSGSSAPGSVPCQSVGCMPYPAGRPSRMAGSGCTG